MTTRRKILLIVGAILLAAVGGFVVWAETPLGPMPEAIAALESDSLVKVEQNPWLVFDPVTCHPQTGLIFYPGGRVDPRSYAPPARAISEKCNLVVIVPMPLNLAVFGYDRAAEVIAAYPEVRHWAISGHSLGGAMAAHFVAKNPSAVNGLAFWAAYPASSDNLSASNLLIVSISATLDGLATPDKIEASKPLLPADTTWVPIEGGNHGQFGWYGDQPRDNPATISREDQQTQAINATLELLAKLN